MVNVIQMRFICAHCHDETWLIAEQTNPIMVRCQGCSDIMVLQNGALFTVSKTFFKKKILKRFVVSQCGKVINHIRVDKPLPSNKITELKTILNEKLDVLDFLDKI